VHFEVEGVLANVGSGVVLVRQLEPGDFVLGHSPRLGGVPIQRSVTAPRALRPDGSPRMDLFAFALKSSADLPRFKVGERLTLEC
jgi:hypothetical protein